MSTTRHVPEPEGRVLDAIDRIAVHCDPIGSGLPTDPAAAVEMAAVVRAYGDLRAAEERERCKRIADSYSASQWVDPKAIVRAIEART